MHGRGGGEHRKRSRHMRSVPTPGTRRTNTAVACDYSSSTVDYFYKDGRKIQVGDCALFKLPQDSTHIIGLIRWLSSNKEKNLSLCVNKLYRPIELKLGKGILLDTLPNEVFYSFRRHEIPAASLLHPCKVAFLNKGVELPSGISSFVCRRVFDPDIRCLQWLSDQEYIDEQQEELDRLLYKTRIEMHASGRSPKPINGPTSTSQLKSGSDNVQTASPVPTQAKGRKRERADQGSEPIKRERSLKADGCDSVLYRSESNLKFEISRITEKGGLVDSEGVVKLVQLMQPNRVDKNLELVSQSMLAGVIAATENFDCLTRFVQLKGLPVLDQWLQDVHKGKVGDGSPKDVDKSTEEFLLILLRALDKLPVNLQALQMCNIGKSVNHLRTYKNSEIQKKARSLVDTWKKRVEAEMNVIDAKSVSNQAVSWQSRSRLPEGSHGGNRQHGGPSEAALKSPAQFSAEKIASTKPALAEISVKLATSSPGPTKVLTSPASGKDGEPRSVVGSNPDLPSNTARDERSSSSSQSHNSQSCSSDHAKTIGLSGKEDARSSTARSISANKVTGGSSRPRRSVNGHPVSAAPSGSPRETGSSRITSLHRNLASEKLSQSGVTCEKALDLPTIDGSCHKLIVKLPNRGRSPVQSSSVGPVEDPAVMHSRVSSPVLSEKNDQSDLDSKEKADVKITSDVKTESWQSNDFKDMLTGSDEGDGSPDAIAEGSRNGNGDAKLADTYKAVSNSLGNKLKSGKLHDASYNSINALIESCVNYSQVNASISGGDDGGMNLLASVAAGEMSKSNLPSTDGSSGRTSNIREESGMGDESRSRETNGDNKLVREPCRSEEGLLGMAKQGNPISVMHEQAVGEDQDKSFKLDSKTIVNLDPHINDRSDEVKDIASISTLPTCAAGKILMGDKSKQLDEKDETNIEAEKSKEDCFSMNDTTLLCSVDAINPNVDHVTSCLEVKREASVGVPSNASLDADNENKDGCYSEQRQSLEVQADAREGCNGLSKDFPSKSTNKFEGIKLEDNECENLAGKRSIGQGTSNVSSNEGHGNRMACDVADESEKIESSATNDSAGASHVNKKPKFDLNEGFNSDDGKLGDPMNFEDTDVPVSAHMVNPLPFPVASMTSGLPASVTVATAAKGPFVPPTDLLRSKRELGWKGSAATSAFRPAEPRKVLEVPSVVGSTPDAGASKHKRPMLDFDLNVADERIVDDVVSRNSAHEIASTSAHAATILEFTPKKPLVSFPLRCPVGLDLDLNRDDEAGDMWLGSASSGRGLEVPFFPAKSSSLSGYPISESRRDLDLNNGPVLDEAVESSLHNKQMRTNIQSQPFLTGLRTSTEETGTFSSWFPPGNAFSPVTIPSIISGRGDQPFPVVTANGPPRVLGPPVGPIPPELYRGSVLSSSPAVPFSSLQYPAFSLGTGFPLPSGSLSGASNTYTDSLSNGRLGLAASNAQLLSGPPSAVTSHFPRPYAVSILDGSNSTSVGNNSKLGRQGLDLNTGPGTQEMESRDESSPLVSKHLSVFSPQVLAEEQGRMNQQVAGGVLKRKENTDIRYKQPSWQ